MLCYQQAGYKTKEEAVFNVLKMLVASPGVAGLDGYCILSAFGKTYRIKPVKKKRDEEK